MLRCRSCCLTVTAIVLGCGGSSNAPGNGSGGNHTAGGTSVTAGAVSSGGTRSGGGALTAGGGPGTDGIAGFGATVGTGGVAGSEATGTGGISSAGGVGNAGGMSRAGGSGGTGPIRDGSPPWEAAARDAGADTTWALDSSKLLDGQIAADEGCQRAPIDAAQAAAMFRDHVFRVQPSMNPTAEFAADELAVPGLWDGLQAQVFQGKILGKDGQSVRDCSFLYGHCAIAFTDGAECKSGGESIVSGLVVDGALYYSWVTGSGISYSLLGKLVPSGNTWMRTESTSYTNSSHGPPNLVVAPDNDHILVYRAAVHWESFNDWKDPELMGTLKDFGDRLGIIDPSGNELDDTLPD